MSAGRFKVLLLDMHSTFMFGEDRFGPEEDFAATYAACGGRSLAPHEIDRTVRAAYAFLAARYADPAFEDDFPSVAEALESVAPHLPATERERLIAVFGQHERGTVPPEYAGALRALGETRELRMISNIWAPKAPWIEELSRAGVFRLFRRTVFSSDTRSMKPSRRLFEQALEGLSWARETVLMIGDSLRCDILGAKRVGLTTALIAPPGATLDSEAATLVDYRLPSLVSLVEDPSVLSLPIRGQQRSQPPTP